VRSVLKREPDIPFKNYSTSKLLSICSRKLNKAVEVFGLIDSGDRIVGAISGGVDSIVMLYLIEYAKRRWQVNFDFIPVHIDQGYAKDNEKWQQIAELCDNLGFELRIERRDIAHRAFRKDAGKNPCFICSRLRRKSLFEMAELYGANKVMLGHHFDDVIETFFLNVMYSREISAMLPKQSLFNGTYHIIRPMYLIDKIYLNTIATRLSLPSISKSCPLDGKTRRSTIQRMLQDVYSDNIKIKKNIFRSLFRPKTKYLLADYFDQLDYLL
jgi:tRNA 2-thiocytidine biosynthesis protein TtcA